MVSGYLHEMDVRVTTKLIQDKVQNFVRQQKATAESDLTAAPAAPMSAAMSAATTSGPASNQSMSATTHTNPSSVIGSNASTQSQAAVSQTTVSHTAVSQTAVSQSSAASITPSSVSTPALQTAALEAPVGHPALSTDSGIVKSETNGSTVSSHPSEVGSSLHGSQQVSVSGQPGNASSNLADSNVSASSQPPSQSSSMSIAGSSSYAAVAASATTTVVQQSLPVNSEPASSTANATTTTSSSTDTDQANQVSLGSAKLVQTASANGVNEQDSSSAASKDGSATSGSTPMNAPEVYANDDS